MYDLCLELFFSETEKNIYFGICRQKANDLRSKHLMPKGKVTLVYKKDVFGQNQNFQKESIVNWMTKENMWPCFIACGIEDINFSFSDPLPRRGSVQQCWLRVRDHAALCFALWKRQPFCASLSDPLPIGEAQAPTPSLTSDWFSIWHWKHVRCRFKLHFSPQVRVISVFLQVFSAF